MGCGNCHGCHGCHGTDGHQKNTTEKTAINRTTLKLHLGRVLCPFLPLRWRLVVEVLRHAALGVLEGRVRPTCQQQVDNRLRGKIGQKRKQTGGSRGINIRAICLVNSEATGGGAGGLEETARNMALRYISAKKYLADCRVSCETCVTHSTAKVHSEGSQTTHPVIHVSVPAAHPPVVLTSAVIGAPGWPRPFFAWQRSPKLPNAQQHVYIICSHTLVRMKKTPRTPPL